MPDRILSVEEILAMLAATPARIAGRTANLAPAALRAAPAPGEWSANEVLAHLRSCADVWGDCIRVILAKDRPTIRAISPRTWIHRTDYPAQDFHVSLQAFTLQRADLLALLEPLSPDEWVREALVTGAGKPFVHTVRSFAQRMAIHERPHLNQIERIIETVRIT